MPRSFAPAIPHGGLARAVVGAAGVGIAAAPSSDDTREAAVVMKHHDHDRMKLRKEIRKQLREHQKAHGRLERKRPPGRGPLGLGPGIGAPGFGDKQLERSPAFALLPDALQKDVRELVTADPEDRRALVEEIRTKALAGDYGPKVEEAARLLEEQRRR